MTVHVPDRARMALVGVLITAAVVTGMALVLGSGREAMVAMGMHVGVGTGLSISPRKLRAMTTACGALAALIAVVIWRTLSDANAIIRVLATVAGLIAVAGPPWLLAGHTNPAISRLEKQFDFVHPPWPRWTDWSDPASPQRRSEDWSTLSSHARRWVENHAEELAVPAGVDSATRQAMATMHLVAQLWGPGNRFATDREGCVKSNEDNRWHVPAVSTLSTYLGARIACCDDFAHMLHWLLREQGFQSRLVTAGGHIFVEVRLPAGWRMLDAFSAIYVDAPFDLINHGGSARVLLAPHVAEWSWTDLYRPDFAAARWRLLTTLFVGGFDVQRSEQLPPPFPPPTTAMRSPG